MERTLIAAIRHPRAAHSLECGFALKNLPGKSCVFAEEPSAPTSPCYLLPQAERSQVAAFQIQTIKGHEDRRRGKAGRGIVAQPLEARDQRLVEPRSRRPGSAWPQPWPGWRPRCPGSTCCRRSPDQLYGGAVFVGQHLPAVPLLLVDPALAVERPADQGGLGDVDGGYHSH